MQNQTIQCAEARHLVHLAVGDDTLAEEENRLAVHLHDCSDCRAYHAGMVDAMQVLEQVRDEDSVDMPVGGVWSAISDKVKSRRITPVAPQRKFSGAVAALCACSLTLALVTIVQSLPMNSPESVDAIAPAMNVSLQNERQIPDQSDLVVERDENGRVVLVNPETKERFYPDLLSTLPAESRNLRF